MLYLIATPIGNLKDITLRALETLKVVDGVICEDSRRSGVLLNQFQIKKPLLVLNDYNEAQTAPMIIEKLKSGQNLALVSDAGTPLIADPGYKLVRQCISEGIPVDSLPGPSSPIVALTLSGLPPDKFLFLGYLPEKQQRRLDLLKSLSVQATVILLVAPHKLLKTLRDLKTVFGDIEIVLAKELTKIHQTIKKGRISDLEGVKPKGEYILLWDMRLKVSPS